MCTATHFEHAVVFARFAIIRDDRADIACAFERK